MMKKNVYIITKPLQYINATNIPDDDAKDCLLVDYFSGSKEFLKNVKTYSNRWENVLLLNNRYKALLYVLYRKRRYRKIFVDSDFSILNRILLLALYPISIYVYEEGFGNYRKTIRKNNTYKRKIINFIDSFLGGNYLGGFYRTERLYLYHTNAFRKLVIPHSNKQISSFRVDFNEHLFQLKEVTSFFSVTILNELEKKDVLVYLTSWEVNPLYLSITKKYPNHIKILKPHPHFTTKIEVLDDFDISVTKALPAEIMISEISRVAKSIVIIHQASSALIYCKNYSNVIEYDLSESAIKNTYENIRLMIMNDCKYE